MADVDNQIPAVERVDSGIWSIPVPIPDNPLGYTLVYLLESSRGPVLVDAGWDEPASRTALTEGLVAAGTQLADVYGVLVTHHHFDHYGLVEFVRESSDAWVALHTADADVVRANIRTAGDGGQRRAWIAGLLTAAGAPQQAIDTLPERFDADRVPVLPDRELVDGQLADVPGWQVRAVHTPGHTPGHTCFHLDQHRRLLSGDHLLPGITPHIALYAADTDADPLGDFFASLDRLTDLDVDEALPAHQYRFAEPKARAVEIAAHHEQRLREVEDALRRDGPSTLWTVASSMTWNRQWHELGLFAQRMAVAEAAAHLRYLTRRGRVTATTGRDAPDVYQLTTD